MFSNPAVTVHGLDDARAALRPGLPVVLLSGEGAALYAGSAWWTALIAAARAEFPATMAADLLDCADAPGRAMEALRLGQRGLILDPRVASFRAVSEAAAARSAIVLPHRPASLDLTDHGAHRRLLAWLERDINQALH